MTTPPLHGVIVGRLKESHLNWIVVSNLLMFLPPGEACHYRIGTTLQVVFVEQNGRSDVKSITPVSRAGEES
jgi:hypothetical protein